METRLRMYRYMVEYQERTGKPPLMREIAEHFGELAYRSSVRHNMMRLVEDRLVVAQGKPGTSRRWRAIE